MTHSIDFRVYYEDTDAGGVVYYANYLKFAERARTEMIRTIGINQSVENFLFVVRKAELDLLKPARLDDLLTIKTAVKQVKGASLVMEQHIYNGQQHLSTVNTVIVTITPDFKPIRLPEKIRQKLTTNV